MFIFCTLFTNRSLTYDDDDSIVSHSSSDGTSEPTNRHYFHGNYLIETLWKRYGFPHHDDDYDDDDDNDSQSWFVTVSHTRIIVIIFLVKNGRCFPSEKKRPMKKREGFLPFRVSQASSTAWTSRGTQLIVKKIVKPLYKLQ